MYIEVVTNLREVVPEFTKILYRNCVSCSKIGEEKLII